jgi:hypothetical protein
MTEPGAGESGVSSAPIKGDDPKLDARPIDGDTRKVIVMWLYFYSAQSNVDFKIKGKKATLANISGLSDNDLVLAYRTAIKFKAGEGFHPTGPPNPLKAFGSIEDAVKALIGAVTSKQFWIRAAEFAIGIVIVGVAVKGAVAPNANVTGTAVKAAKFIK